MIKLSKSLSAHNSPNFKSIVKNEIKNLDPSLLPLQQGLSQSSYVSDSGFDVVVLNVSESDTGITVKTGIFYTGIIAGCSCADDPTPIDEQTEYCELLFEINKSTAETTVTL